MDKRFGSPLSSARGVSEKIRDKLAQLSITTSEELLAMAAVKGCKEPLAKYLGLTASVLSTHLDKVRESLPNRAVAAMEEPYAEELATGALEPPSERRTAAAGPYESLVSVAALPTNTNHISRMPPIKDQAARGTCVGFACTALNEDYSTLYRGSTPDLSEQCLYQRCKENDGIPNQVGTYVVTGMECLVNFGQPSEACAPYNPNLPHNQPGPHRSCCPTESPQWRLLRRQQLNENSTVDIKAALADGKTVAFSIPAYDSWRASAAVKRTGNITMPLPDEDRSGGHAMLFVGYQDDASTPGGGYFILRNSWNTTWGYQSTYGAGYGTLPYKYMTDHGWEAWTYERLYIACPPSPRMPFCPPMPSERLWPPMPFEPICPPMPFEPICPPMPFERLWPPRPVEPICPPMPFERLWPPRPIAQLCPVGPGDQFCPVGPRDPWWQGWPPRRFRDPYARYYPQGHYSHPEAYYPPEAYYAPEAYYPSGYCHGPAGRGNHPYWPVCSCSPGREGEGDHTDPRFGTGTFNPHVRERR